MEQIQNIIFSTVYYPAALNAARIITIFAMLLLFRIIDIVGCRIIDKLFRK